MTTTCPTPKNQFVPNCGHGFCPNCTRRPKLPRVGNKFPDVAWITFSTHSQMDKCTHSWPWTGGSSVYTTLWSLHGGHVPYIHNWPYAAFQSKLDRGLKFSKFSRNPLRNRICVEFLALMNEKSGKTLHEVNRRNCTVSFFGPCISGNVSKYATGWPNTNNLVYKCILQPSLGCCHCCVMSDSCFLMNSG